MEIPGTVTSIGQYVFRNCTNLTSVIFGEGTTSIGQYALAGNTNITQIHLPESLTSLGEGAFQNCTALTSVNIPAGLSSGYNAFNGCSALTEVELEAGMEKVPAMLLNNTGITGITIPEGVTVIDRGAFYNCTKLEEVTLPSTLEKIGNEAFARCTSLQSIELPEGVIRMGGYWNTSYSGNWYNDSSNQGNGYYNGYVFNGCTALTEVTLPKELTSASYTFNGCTALAKLNMIASSSCNIKTVLAYASTSYTIESDDQEIAYIDNNSMIYAVKEGSCTLTVSNDGGTVKTFALTVLKATIDTDPPVITRMLPANYSYLSGSVKFEIHAQDNYVVRKILTYWSTDSGETWTEFTGQLDTTQFADTEIRIRAIAYDAAGNASDSLTYVYMIDNSGPAQVTGLYGESTSISITLHWDKVEDEDTGYFQVEQRKADGSYQVINSPCYTLGANIFNLIPDTEYTFRVTAFDQHGNQGAISEPVTVRTQSDEMAPVISRITPASGYYSGDIPVSVTAQDDYNVTAVIIQISSDQSTWTDVYTQQYTGIQSSRSLSYTVSTADLAEGAVYVRAFAADGAGNVSDTSESAPFVQHIIDRTAPAAPANVSATGYNGYIEISWTQGTEEDLGAYSIYRSSSADGTFTLLAGNLRAINYFDRSVQENETWYYKLTVNDQAGNVSSDSIIVSATALTDTEAPEIVSIYPTDGSTLGNESRSVSVMVVDNQALQLITIEYSSDRETYTELLKEDNLNCRDKVIQAELPLDSFLDGDIVYVRTFVEDRSGNESAVSEAVYYLDLEAPVVLEASAVYDEEEECVRLTWTSGKERDLLGYLIYRKLETEEDFRVIAQEEANGDETYTLSDYSIGLDEASYIYKVEAVDSCWNTSSVELPAVTVPDRNPPHVLTAPVAILSCEMVLELDEEYIIDASESYDDSQIVSYLIDFGDGSDTVSTPQAVHAYHTTGTYTITLTVVDDEDLETTVTKDIEVRDSSQVGTAKIRIVDENGYAVPNAPVYFDLASEDQVIRKTDGSGWATFSAGEGTHTVGCVIANNEWLPVKKEIVVRAGEVTEVTMTMVHHVMVEGSFEITPMTFDDIVAAGIDVTAPENQYYVLVTVYLLYEGITVSTTSYYNPVTGHSSAKPIIIRGGGSSHGGDRLIIPQIITPKYSRWIPYDGGGDSGSSASSLYMEPSIAWIEIPIGVYTLKEFFNVDLHIVNNAGSEFSLLDNVVTLNVPEGLTIMDTDVSEPKAVATRAEIKGQTEETISWILRGDEVGKYYLTADYTGVISEFNETVSTQFIAEDALEVYGLSDLKLTVEVSDLLMGGELYYSAALTNEGTRDIYCPKMETPDRPLLARIYDDLGIQTQEILGDDVYSMDLNTLSPGCSVIVYYVREDEDTYDFAAGVLRDYYYEMENSYGLNVEIVVKPYSYFIDILDYLDGWDETIDGVLRQGEGWSLRWECTYHQMPDGSKHYARLRIYMRGSNADDDCIHIYNENDDEQFRDAMPWFAEEYGLTKNLFTSITITGTKDNPLYIIPNLFEDYSRVVSVSLDEVSGIGEQAFKNCKDLKSISIYGGKLTSIESEAFRNTGLTRITLLRNVDNIGVDAFKDCNYLTIYCYKYSCAHTYADDNDIRYELLKDYRIYYEMDGETKSYPLGRSLESYVFETDSKTYNSELSRLLMRLATAIYNEKNMQNSLDALDFILDREHFRYNYSDSWVNYLSGYIIAKKTLEDGSDFVLICIRGSVGYNWNNLLNIRSIGKYPAMENDAKRVYNDLVDLLGGSIRTSNITYVITGHSQGAGAANLLAVKLYDNGVPASIVYDYNYACPNVAALVDFWNFNPSGAHDNIFNIGNTEDIVSLIPPNLTHKIIGALKVKYGASLAEKLNGILSLASEWGKFGRSYWFVPRKDREGFDSHEQSAYIDELDYYPYLNSYGIISLEGDLLWQLGRYLGAAIFCPVDVVVYDETGTPVAGVINNEAQYYDSTIGEVLILTVEDEKILLLPPDHTYEFRMNATDEGEMTYLVFNYYPESDEITEDKTFIEVNLEEGKQMYSQVGSSVEIPDTKLYVLDEEEKIVAEVLEDGSEEPYTEIAVTGLTLNTEQTSLYTGSSLTLQATVEPADTTNQKVTWSSSNEKVATVDENGVVTAHIYGTAVITATAEDETNGKITASCTVNTLFYDVIEGYYYKPVYWAADLGITKGYSSGAYAGAFGVGLECTRQELMTFLWRFAGKPAVDGDARTMFNDVTKGANTDANKAIAWGYQNGIVKGYPDGGFHPDAPIVRKDVMIMLYRLAGKPAVNGETTFTDVIQNGYKKTSDTYKAILWGVQKGITKGYSSGDLAGQFGCTVNCQREQIVTFLYRYGG